MYYEAISQVLPGVKLYINTGVRAAMSRCFCRWNLWREPKEVTQNEEKGILDRAAGAGVDLAAGSVTPCEDQYACTVRFSKIIHTTRRQGCTSRCPFWTA